MKPFRPNTIIGNFQSPLTRRESLLLSIIVILALFAVFQNSAPQPTTPLYTMATSNHAVEEHYGNLHRRDNTTIRNRIPNTQARECKKKNLDTIKANLHSQFEEDKHLLSRWNGLCGGSYVEMGAYDGSQFSNSWVFAKEFQWKGVMVELTPSKFAVLQKNRPHELALVHAAVCLGDRKQKVHMVDKGLAYSGIWEFASDEFRKLWWPSITSAKGLPEIDCMPLQMILDERVTSRSVNEEGMFFFDFFSLDVEGAEWNVLRTLDWDRTAFGIIFVESPDHKGRDRDSITVFLQRKGYRYVGDTKNTLWFLHQYYDEIYKNVT